MNLDNFKFLKKYISNDEYLILENRYNPIENLNFETKFTLVSSLMSLRASHFEGDIRNTLPANYMHGVFDKDRAFQRELCNLPNWNLLKIYFETDKIGIESPKKIYDYKRILDIKKGIVLKTYIHESLKGNKTKIESIHFLDRNNPNTATIRIYITPINYSGKFEFENIIDASISNFIDYPRFRVKHYKLLEYDNLKNNGIYTLVETNDSKLKIMSASKVKVFKNEKEIKIDFYNKSYGEYAIEFFDVDILKGESVVIEKNIYVEKEITDDRKNYIVNNFDNYFKENFEIRLNEHFKYYENMYKRAEIEIKGNKKLEKAMRFNIFHLMSTPNFNDNKTNIGAKLLHGEEYGGHAFWDSELFILPYFNLVFPEIAKNLVEYRYEMLEGARKNAIKYGYKGARYPWESADYGDEQCPEWTIEPDGTCYKCNVAEQEIHITSDIIYGGYNYYKITNNEEYYYKFLEMLFETSRYLYDRLEYNKNKDIFELNNVMGPDEWHENVNNNTYTNYLVKWHLKLFDKLIKKEKYNIKVNEILKKIKMNNKEIKDIISSIEKIYLPQLDGIIEQFDGYFNLIDEEIYEYDKNKMPILPKKLKGINRELTTINKQADVIMLLFLFNDEFSKEIQKLNYKYYEKRTLHRSSLSPSIFSIMGFKLDENEYAYEYLKRSILVDYDNNQGNLREGIHAASIGGSWQALVYGVAGLEIRENDLYFNPKLPKEIRKLKFNLVYKNKLYKVSITKGDVKIEKENLN